MPYVSGELEMPASEHLFMLPQRTYIPFGKLRDVLTYPQNNVSNDKILIDLLTLCGLEEWGSSLDIEKIGHKSCHWGSNSWSVLSVYF